jgi:hypothetical protein
MGISVSFSAPETVFAATLLFYVADDNMDYTYFEIVSDITGSYPWVLVASDLDFTSGLNLLAIGETIEEAIDERRGI